MDLDTKYRPIQFSEVSGNSKIIKTITTHLTNNTLPNVIIMAGLSGCGKTTLSYLVIKSLLCENNSGQSEPCGQCPTCKAVHQTLYTTGQSVNGLGIHTFDMSLYGDESEYIKNICNVIDSPIAPTKKRVILLEELHITTKTLQEKLDRVLEYIKPNVYVFICTSNIKNIVKPIQRRAHIFTVSTPTKEEQTTRLRIIAAKEGHPLTEDKLTKLIEVSGFNPAKCLKNLSTIINAGEAGLDLLLKETEEEYDAYIEYFDSIKLGILGIIQFIEEKLDNPVQFINGIQNFIYQTLKLRYYTPAVATQELRKKVKVSMGLYSDRTLVEILNHLSKISVYSGNDAKRHLLLLAFKINENIFNTIYETDTQNAINYSLEKEQKDDSQNEPIPSDSLSWLSGKSFDFNNIPSTININDL